MAGLLADGWFYISSAGLLVSGVLFFFLLSQYRAAADAADQPEPEAAAESHAPLVRPLSIPEEPSTRPARSPPSPSDKPAEKAPGRRAREDGPRADADPAPRSAARRRRAA